MLFKYECMSGRVRERALSRPNKTHRSSGFACMYTYLPVEKRILRTDLSNSSVSRPALSRALRQAKAGGRPRPSNISEWMCSYRRLGLIALAAGIIIWSLPSLPFPSGTLLAVVKSLCCTMRTFERFGISTSHT